MTKISEILLKINKCKETELLCEHQKLINTIVDLTKAIADLEKSMLQEIKNKDHGVNVDLYKYIETTKAKIAQHFQERKILENQELSIIKRIKENFNEREKYKRLEQIETEKSLTLLQTLNNKTENEHSNSKHTFDQAKK